MFKALIQLDVALISMHIMYSFSTAKFSKLNSDEWNALINS